MTSPLNIIRVLRKHLATRDKLFSDNIEHETDDTLCRRFFSNYRKDDASSHGLRLTNEGYEVFAKVFQHYTIQFPADYLIKSRHLIFLDRACTMPWHISKNRLILFEPELAMQLKLVSDLDTLIETLGGDVL